MVGEDVEVRVGIFVKVGVGVALSGGVGVIRLEVGDDSIVELGGTVDCTTRSEGFGVAVTEFKLQADSRVTRIANATRSRLLKVIME